MKVLVISHNSFSKVYNNGKTLSAIFSAYSKEEICQLYFTPIGDPDYERCESYYQITDKDALLSIIKRWNCGTTNIHGISNHSKKCSGRKQTVLKMFARTIIWIFSSWYNGGLKKWIQEQKPDSVFYVGGNSVFSHIIAVSISRRFNIPLATYFTDDYVINPQPNIYINWLKRYYVRTITQSTVLFAIGKQMAYDYSEYYGKEFLPIMNIVDIPQRRIKTRDFTASSICYFGGLHLGRDEEIVRFAEYLSKNLDNHHLSKVQIFVYTFTPISDMIADQFSRLSIIVRNGVSGDELVKAMNESDIFLHVESVKEEYRSLTKLSVSTKIPEYMSFAKPIVAFGPSDVASFRVISEVNPELVCNDSPDKNRLFLEKFKQILDNSKLYDEICMKNYDFAKANFNKDVVASDFRRIISSMHDSYLVKNTRNTKIFERR